MKPTDFLLCLIDVFEESIEGRTLLQKRAYFVAELTGEDFGLKFDAHFYGPFSQTVEGTATQLTNLGFLKESSTGFGIVNDGFEVRRYDYTLTEDGKSIVKKLRGTPDYKKISDASRRILNAGNPTYMELSIAAKAYFLLKRKEGKGMSRTDLIKEAEKYSWSISPGSVKRAIDFLKAVDLASEK